MSPNAQSPYISARYCLRGWLLELALLGVTAPILVDEICEVLELSQVRAVELAGGDC
jgi:hypothetical protein